MHVRGSAVEVSTGECNDALLQQAALADVAPGGAIFVRVGWGALDAPEPAIGELRLSLGPREVWHETVAIPGRSDMREALIVSPTALPAGAQLSFIVTGRGANAWSLGELSVRKPE